MTIKCKFCGGDVAEELVGDEDFTVLMCIDCGEHPDPEIEDAYYERLNQDIEDAIESRFLRYGKVAWDVPMVI